MQITEKNKFKIDIIASAKALGQDLPGIFKEHPGDQVGWSKMTQAEK